VIKNLVGTFKLSERRSCSLVGLSRSGYRYKAVKNKDGALKQRMLELAAKHPSYGYPVLHELLKAEGLVVNAKRTYRIYRAEKLQVRTKQRKKLIRPRLPLTVPIGRDIRWSMDFVNDQLSNGRRFRVLNVMDDYSREVVGQLTDFSISGARVARFLNELMTDRSKPDQIVCDNGTEFTSKAMFFWQEQSGVKLSFIQPGKPTQNAFVESLNGKFRNECLNQHWFQSIEQAVEQIDQWRYHFNHERPHSSLKFMTPVAFVNKAA